MKKGILLFCIILVVAVLCSCSSKDSEATIENGTGSSIAQTEENSKSNVDSPAETLQDGWEYFNIEAFDGADFSSDETHFLMTEEVSMEGQVYKTDVDNTHLLLEIFQNLQVKNITQSLAYADYYLLLRNDEDEAVCLIEVWDGYICINWTRYYEVSGSELFTAVSGMMGECEELHKISAEDVLVAHVNAYSYGEFDKEDIVLHDDCPAILVESGYDKKDSGEEYYYETFIYCDGLYFDPDYQTTYMLVYSKVIHYADGSIGGTYRREAYYDYFTGERMPFMH